MSLSQKHFSSIFDLWTTLDTRCQWSSYVHIWMWRDSTTYGI